ncbi:hypothetical protein ABK040_004430 [Willaertia magna]
MVRFTNFKSSPNPKESHKYEKYGTLQKMGEINKSWKERYFILEDDKLFYYKNLETNKAIAYIPLSDAYVRVSNEYFPKVPCFEIVTCQRIYKLLANNFETMKSWMLCIQNYSKVAIENNLIRQAEQNIKTKEFDFTVNYLENNFSKNLKAEKITIWTTDYSSGLNNEENDEESDIQFNDWNLQSTLSSSLDSTTQPIISNNEINYGGIIVCNNNDCSDNIEIVKNEVDEHCNINEDDEAVISSFQIDTSRFEE